MTCARRTILAWPAIVVAMLAAMEAVAAEDAPPPNALQEGLRAYSHRDFSQAIRHWRPLAQRGDASAQYNLGRMYARGEGVQRDLPEAYKWFALAGAAGRPEGDRARQALSRSMTPVQQAEGLRRAEEWRQRRR